MRARTALLAIALLLPGCTDLPGATPEAGQPSAMPEPPPGGPPPLPEKVGVFDHGERVDTRNATLPPAGQAGNGTTALANATGNASAPSGTRAGEGGNATSPASGNSTTATDGDATGPPAGGNATGPPAGGNATAPPGNGTDGDGNGTAPPGREEAALPAWHVGDLHQYRGVDDDGTWFNETRSVIGIGSTYNTSVYQVQVSLDNRTALENITVDGLNRISTTGVVTKLYDFPLWEGKNWTYGYNSTLSRVAANVTVLGLENLTVPAGEFRAWHLHNEVTYTFGTGSKTSRVDYWFAEVARDTVKAVSADDAGATVTEELVVAELA
jgi:hypothetical protein